ncbi:DUF6867 family protein [Ferrovibrio sp. MS7]|jgi:hypothetical protein|uniref:DUF6867 family protein n=1 Tax=Ferrovibrio TaxID=1231242 RepID=UPI001B48C313|nr:hypothetical protein [Ferrovibrio sp.]
MTALLGSSLGVFIGFTLILVGGCSFLMGQAVASTWRPAWQILPYSILLALADRFLVFGLFGGQLGALLPFLTVSAVLLALAGIGFRLTRVDMMVRQYPWLYERAGLFAWRDKTS